MPEQTAKLYDVQLVIAQVNPRQIKKAALATLIVIVIAIVFVYWIYAYVSGILSPMEQNVSIHL